jgi:hypothetical protein
MALQEDATTAQSAVVMITETPNFDIPASKLLVPAMGKFARDFERDKETLV